MPFALPQFERDPLWRREMLGRWRRPVTLFLLAFYALGLSYSAYSLYRAIVPPGAVRLGVQSHGIGHRLFLGLLTVQILSWIPIALLLGAPTIAAERERYALTEYLLAQLSSHQIVWAKFSALATFILVMCAIPLPLLALCFPLGGVDPLEFVGGFVLEVAVATACAALGILISTHNRRVPPAIQNAVFLSLVFLVLGAMIVPGLLSLSPVVWLVCAGVLAGGTLGLVGGCTANLSIIANNLELEEQNPQLGGFSFAPLPETPPIVSAESIEEEVDDEVEGFSWDAWAETMAGGNAVALREVRVGIRAARRRAEQAPPPSPYRYSLWVWALSGLGGGIVATLINMFVWIYVALAATTFAAVVGATVGSSAAFTREREQKMLTQLRVCPLSPLEIVSGKIGAVLLLVARTWGGLFLAFFLAVLTQGVFIALEAAAFVLLTLLFAVGLATLLSLVCQRTSIAASVAIGILFVFFGLLPLAPGTLVYFLPVLRAPLLSFPLGPMWIEPMGQIRWSVVGFSFNSLSSALALLRLNCSLAVLSAFLIGATIMLWARNHPDEGEVKVRFWERARLRS